MGGVSIDDDPRVAVDHRLGRPAGAPGDHRQPGEGGFGKDDAEALDLETTKPGARRAGEDVGRLQPETQLIGRDLAW
jgi:hypothetical protein